MEDVNLPDVSNVRGSGDKRELPPQASAEDTSNWDNRAIALPDPKRSAAQFITTDDPDTGIILDIENPYLAQARITPVKRKKLSMFRTYTRNLLNLIVTISYLYPSYP